MASYFRLFRIKYQAVDTTGSFLAGGRWNSKGFRVLYTSSSLSLACLEVLVHVVTGRLPLDYAYVRIEVADDLVEIMSGEVNISSAEDCRRTGDEWLLRKSKMGLIVPSIIIPTENNLLLNPDHPDFAQAKFSEPQPFSFDSRLLKSKLTPVD